MCKVLNKYKATEAELENSVYVGRPSIFGNPFTHLKGKTAAKYKVSTREEAIESYREWVENGEGHYIIEHLHELKGKNLVCWCDPLPCHAHILMELIEKYCKDD